MMAKQKSEHIYLSMIDSGCVSEHTAKKCAILAVDEINKVLSGLEPKVHENELWLYREIQAKIPYWKEVRECLNEIEPRF